MWSATSRAASFKRCPASTRANTWAGEELCATPEIMRDVLLDCFTGYLEYKAITANGEITVAEQERIATQRQALLEKLQ